MGKPIKATDRSKPWYRPGNRTSRPVGIRAKRERILIVCEGKKTEPNYFESIRSRLPRHLVEIDIEGEGMNTLSLVRNAVDRRRRAKESGHPFDQVWIVFDRDSFPAAAFDNAIHMAEAQDMHCAWSNEAFELWYLLHFEDRQSAMSRSQYKGQLTRHLGRKYEKNALDMYELLQELGDADLAIRRGNQLKKEHKGTPASSSNPCTTVGDLVEALNSFLNPQG